MTHNEHIRFTHEGLIQAVLSHGILLNPAQACQQVQGDAHQCLQTPDWQQQTVDQVLLPELAAEYRELYAELQRVQSASVRGKHLILIPLFETGWMVLRVKASQQERQEDRSGHRPSEEPEQTTDVLQDKVGLVYLTPDLTVQYANQAFLDLIGAAAGSDSSPSIQDLIHKAFPQVHDLASPEVLEQQVSLNEQQALVSIREARGTDGERLGYILQAETPGLKEELTEQLRLQEERWRYALESIGDGVWDWDVARDQVYLSRTWFGLIGEDLEDCTQPLQQWLGRLIAEDQPRMLEALQACVHQDAPSYQVEVRVQHRNGDPIWMLARGKVIARNAYGEGVRLVGTLTDITQLKNTEQELERLTERIQLATRTVGIGVWEWNIEQNRMLWDQHMLDIYGLTQEQFEENSLTAWDRRLHPEDAARVLQEVDWALNDVKPFETEYRIVRPDGTQRVVRSSASVVRDAEGKPLRFLGVDWDITAHKQAEELIQYQTSHDSLTGLPNRKLFMDLLGKRLEEHQASGRICAVLFINLDRFKDVNDSMGHEAGDILLKEVATRLKLCVRESDLVARVGGDEFTIMLSNLDEGSQAGNISERILKILSHPYQIKQKAFLASASLGISLFPSDVNDAETLLTSADQAMSVAKGEGKNCWRFFTPSMLQATRERRTVISDFTLALKRQEFEVYYQPILGYGRPDELKAEALLRWKHPQKGMISPAVFIPLAEEVGLIHALGDWCLKRVLQDQQKWQAEGLPCPVIAINTSAKQFTHDDVARKWLQALRDSGASSDQLVMEITESLLLQRQTEVLSQLRTLREAGIRIALDDFGTGYSSLSYLSAFELDYLKIDRSFVQGIVQNSKDEAVTDAIIAMAHKLGLEVVAEGVETLEQEEVLRRQHCDFAQGYYYARPMPEAQYREFIQKQVKVYSSQ
ncbi:EAL domain-containing protein [Deinococcus cellulosilyticus]|uniref:Diguanylate cyclase/phosphodiesterase with PAS/PAC sensor(S) n=1 Tax=Deinococcus cellulosilyticus (strain DSM 18568 / NBRC 106333 / KACC 11606 / 5516J-15) TaxID=1223518 RepID=A0A511N977_DEIC1|nr:EAL domain-containing protein [Deinococcus cellulosilyticus]GEM49384.1 hypothetical protein DC3_50190 [Deinococcus cellulosilyticus NBRC 106333 = KACC 11606]